MKTKELKHKKFLQLWGSTPLLQTADKRQKIMETCNVSRNVFYDWLSGRTEIPNASLLKIRQIYKSKK